LLWVIDEIGQALFQLKASAVVASFAAGESAVG
jgi:hypothetical protein